MMRKAIRNLIQIGIDDTMSFNDKRNVRITNIVAVNILAITLLFLIPLFWLREYEDVIENILTNIYTALPAILVLYLNKIRYYKLGLYILFIFFSFFLIGLPPITGRDTGTHLQFVILMASAILLFNNRITILFFFVLSSIMFMIGAYLSSTANPMQLEMDYPLFWINSFSTVILFYFAINAFKIESQKYQVKIEENNDELSSKNKQISDSIAYAERIQKAMLPDIDALKQTFPECFVFYQPKDVVSGDFYWFQQMENHWILAVGDCTGHGVPGALMSMLGISFLEQITVEKKITQPHEILLELDQLIRKTLKQEQTENQDGLDIAICTVNLEKKEILFAGANNPLWIIENSKLIEFKGTKRGIGGRIANHLNNLDLHSYNYNPQTTIYLSSDGYKDQFGGKDSKKFSSQKLKKLLESISKEEMQQQGILIETEFKNWIGQGNELQTDDVTIFGIRL